VDLADLVPAVAVSAAGVLPRFLLHVMVLGALLAGARHVTDDGRGLGLGVEPIVVSAAQVEQLRLEWRAAAGREPSRAELAASVQAHADEEALLAEALRLGLDRGDPVVRTRLVRNLRFARGEDAAGAADDALLAEALALGMARRDRVARRRLVLAMEERLAAPARVSEREARAHVAAHPERYAAPARVDLVHVFVSADRHGALLAQRAAELGRQLAAGAPDAAPPPGDPFLAGTRFTAQSQADLARVFGARFAAEALAAPVAKWSGPIRSAYGEHFVRVTALHAPVPADEAAVLRQARYALLDERERALVRDARVALRRAYPLRVEWPALALAGAP
jgi:hypothetical protein